MAEEDCVEECKQREAGRTGGGGGGGVGVVGGERRYYLFPRWRGMCFSVCTETPPIYRI